MARLVGTLVNRDLTLKEKTCGMVGMLEIQASTAQQNFFDTRGVGLHDS